MNHDDRFSRYSRIGGSLLAGGLTAAAAVCLSRKRRRGEDEKNWFRHVVNATPAYLWMGPQQGLSVFVNATLAAFLGVGGQFLEDWREYVHPEDREQAIRGFSEAVAAQREYFDEYRIRRFDGEYRWMGVRGKPRFSQAGKYLGYAGALFDITLRRTAEESAQSSARLLRGQNRTLQLIASGAPLSRTLGSILEGVDAEHPEVLSSILLLDADGVHLRHGAAPRLPEAYRRAIDGEPIGPCAGSCGTAAYRNETVVVEDIATDPLWRDYRETALAHGLRACWSMPICDEQQRVLGTFALYFREPRRPTEDQQEMVRMATHTAAIAIARDRESEALRSSEERLRLAVSGGNVGIWDWDIVNDRLTLNDPLKGMLGWSSVPEKERTLRMFRDAIHPADRARTQAASERSVRERTDFREEFRVVSKQGRVHWLAGMGGVEFGADGKPLRMVGVSIDITDRKQAEEEISRRDAQLVYAQHLAQLGSYEWDIAANRVDRSEELCRIFGLRADEFEPTFDGYLARVHPDHRETTRTTIERSLQARTPFEFEERIVRPDGTVRTLYSRGRWICDDAGVPVKLVGTCQDITERKRIEQELQAANDALAQELQERVRTERQVHALSALLISAQEEERSRIARELHDDLSQQIAAVSIATSNLKKGIEDADSRAQSERIQEKLVALAESTRRISHELHPAVLRHAGLAPALEGYCAELRELTRTRISFEAHGSFGELLPTVALCAYRVTQEALRNVVRHAKTDEARVVLTHEGGTLRLMIADSGVGMDLGVEAGGLGLISIKERARLVNGRIEIRSRPGQGTTVTLTIPTHVASVGAGTAKGSVEKPGNVPSVPGFYS